MYVVAVWLRPLPSANRCHGSAQVVDAVWSQAVVRDGIEHVTVRVGVDEIDIVFFVRASRPEEAELIAHDLCRRVLSAVPLLSGWILVEDH